MSGRKSGLIILIAVILVAGLVFATSKSKTAKPVEVNSPSPVVTSTPSSVEITPEYRAEIRASFLDSCGKTLGYGKGDVCNCMADYLTAHYSDSQLVKLFVEYHATNKVPAEMNAALDTCSSVIH